MLTDFDNYRLRTGNWQEFKRKIERIPETDGPFSPGADIGRNIILDGGYFCNLSLYNSQERIAAFFVGIPKEGAKGLLEKVLQTPLESVPEKSIVEHSE